MAAIYCKPPTPSTIRPDLLAGPECGGQMKVIAFLEPPQADVTCLPTGRLRRS
jgi:hypothetical protein